MRDREAPRSIREGRRDLDLIIGVVGDPLPGFGDARRLIGVILDDAVVVLSRYFLPLDVRQAGQVDCCSRGQGMIRGDILDPFVDLDRPRIIPFCFEPASLLK